VLWEKVARNGQSTLALTNRCWIDSSGHSIIAGPLSMCEDRCGFESGWVRCDMVTPPGRIVMIASIVCVSAWDRWGDSDPVPQCKA